MKKTTKLLIFVGVVCIFILYFSYNPTSTKRVYSLNNIAGAYAPPATTISPTTGWVNSSTTFTLSPTSATSTAWAAGSQAPDMYFDGYVSGNEINTYMNWTDSPIANCYCHAITWPQVNSWSNYSSTNTGYGYNKIGAIMYDQSASAADYAYWTLPGYVPTGNTWYYVAFEIQPQAESSSQCYYVALQDITGSTYGIKMQFLYNGSIEFEGKCSNTHTSSMNWTAGTDYFIRFYLNPSTYKCYWSLNGTVYTFNSGNWNWMNNNVADVVKFMIANNMAGTGNFYVDNIDCSWSYTFPNPNWATVPAPFQFKLGTSYTDGSTIQIGYNSTGINGMEATHLIYVQYDKSAPTLAAVAYSSIYNASTIKGWITPSATITLSASDSESGIGAYNYRIMGVLGTSYYKSWATYSSPFSISNGNGTYQVQWAVWDNVGNNVTQSFIIRVIDPPDTIAPTTNCTFTPAYTSGPKNYVADKLVYTENFDEYADGSDFCGKNGWASDFNTDPTCKPRGTSLCGYWSGNFGGATLTLPASLVQSGMWDCVQFQICCSSNLYGFPIVENSGGTWLFAIGYGMFDDCFQYYAGSSWVNMSPKISFVYNNWVYLRLFWSADSSKYYIQCSADGSTWQTSSIYSFVVSGTPAKMEFRTFGGITYVDNMKFTQMTALTLSATDNGGSGVASTHYKIYDNDTNTQIVPWSIFSLPFSLGIQPNDTFTVVFDSIDYFNNNESLKYQVLYVNTITPTISPAGMYNSTGIGWILPSSSITISGIDNTRGSGIAGGGWKWVGISGTPGTHAWTTFTGTSTSFTIPSNGTYRVWYDVYDNLGYNGTGSTYIIRVDANAPATTISFVPAYTSGSKSWVTTSTMFTLTPTDNTNGSGVNKTYYMLTGSGFWGWRSGTSFNLAGYGYSNGTYKIAYYSTDNVGNVETTQSLTVYIDTIAPTSTISIGTPEITVGSKNYIVPSTTPIALTGTDNVGGSGASMLYALGTYPGGEDFHEFNSGTPISSAHWTITETSGTSTFKSLAVGGDTVGDFNDQDTGSLLDCQYNFVTTSTGAAGDTLTWNENLQTVPENEYFEVNVKSAGGTWYCGLWTGELPFAFYSVGLGGVQLMNISTRTTYTISFVVQSATQFYWVINGVVYNNGGSYYTVIQGNLFTNKIGMLEITMGGADGIENSYFDNIHSNWQTSFLASDWTTYSSPFTFSNYANSTVTIAYKSTDQVGNMENAHAQQVCIDTIAPTTMISFLPALQPNYVNNATLFTLTSSDNIGGTGVACMYFKYTGMSAYQVYTGPFNLSPAAPGNITISYYSIDNAGNVDSIKTVNVILED